MKTIIKRKGKAQEEHAAKNKQEHKEERAGKSTPAAKAGRRKLTIKKEVETTYEVEKIIDRRVDSKGREEYLVVWKGYENNDDNNTWQLLKDLSECTESVDAFKKELRSRTNSRNVRKSNDGGHSQTRTPKRRSTRSTKAQSEDKESSPDSTEEFASQLNKKAKLSGKKSHAKSTAKKAKIADTESEEDEAPPRRNTPKKNYAEDFEQSSGDEAEVTEGNEEDDESPDVTLVQIGSLPMPKNILTKKSYMQISKKYNFKERAKPLGTSRTIFGTEISRCLAVLFAERALLIELVREPKNFKCKLFLVDLQLAAEIIPTVYEEALKRINDDTAGNASSAK